VNLRRSACLAFSIATAGCAGLTGDLPRASDPREAVRVLVTHEFLSVAGSGNAIELFFDGSAFAKLRDDDCIEFSTDPGTHFLVLTPGYLVQGVVKFEASAGGSVAIQCFADFGRFLGPTQIHLHMAWCVERPFDEVLAAVSEGDFECIEP
jgi:hypothetical protein